VNASYGMKVDIFFWVYDVPSYHSVEVFGPGHVQELVIRSILTAADNTGDDENDNDENECVESSLSIIGWGWGWCWGSKRDVIV